MASIDVTILQDSYFGSRGSGNDQFDYPAGICVANDLLYIVDKQNNRVKIHDLDGVYVDEFGTFGSGNDNFFYPEAIATDGVNLYIVDSANHRIKVHDLNGVFVSAFGTRGAGNTQFEYPKGISIYNGFLFIADTQNNRVKMHETDGTFVFEITGLNFPDGTASIDNQLVLSDSANRTVKFYSSIASPLFDSEGSFEYPSLLKETDGVICIVDKQASRLGFVSSAGEFLRFFGEEGTSLNKLLFPADVVYYDGFLYVVDGGNHRIKKYDFKVSANVPIFADLFSRLTKRLYPTGRAWWMKRDSIFDKFHLGLAYSESRARSAVQDLLNSIIPDNDNFTEEDATRWESALGLFTSEGAGLDARKEAILRKMKYPGGAPARQHWAFVQGELQNAGFNVFVYENRFGDPPSVISLSAALYGSFQYSEKKYGQAGIDNTTIIANYIDEAKDENFNFGSDINLRATFFIGGATFGTRATVDPDRKREFREMILKLKPAQTAGILYIDYVKPVGIGFDEIGTTLEVY